MVSFPLFLSQPKVAIKAYLCRMICIDIEYRSWWWPFARRKRSYAPSRWWEMDESHYMAIVRAILGEISDDEYCAALFGLPRRLVSRLDPWHRYVLGKQLRWMESGKSESSRFFIRSIEGLKAPADALAGVSLQQFMTVDTFFTQYAESITDSKPQGDPQRLCRMVAALYLRPDETYFAEQPEEEVADIEGNAKMLQRHADLAQLWGVYLNWVMVRNWLSKAYPLLFPSPDSSKSDSSKDTTPHKVNAWLDAFDSFMGDDVAHIDAYRRMDATDAFRLMNKRMRSALTHK